MAENDDTPQIHFQINRHESDCSLGSVHGRVCDPFLMLK